MYPSPCTSFIEVSDDATADDDAKMEDLFREIVVDDSTSSATGESSGRAVQVTAPAVASATSTTTTEVGKTEKQGQGECLGKRKREEDEESSRAVKKPAFDGMDLGIGANPVLDFGFDWSNPVSPATAPLTPDEMQQMLNQLDATNAMMQFPNDLGLDVAMPMDLGIWSNTATAGVF